MNSTHTPPLPTQPSPILLHESCNRCTWGGALQRALEEAAEDGIVDCIFCIVGRRDLGELGRYMRQNPRVEVGVFFCCNGISPDALPRFDEGWQWVTPMHIDMGNGGGILYYIYRRYGRIPLR